MILAILLIFLHYPLSGDLVSVQSTNLVTHLCWDNFDINEETKSGFGTTHSTHGIVVQEVDDSAAYATGQTSDPQLGKCLSFKHESTTLQPCFAKRKCEPVVKSAENNTELSLLSAKQQQLSLQTWLLCHGLFNSNESFRLEWVGV